MDTMSLTAKYEDEMITIRRHIHRHPELSNKEYKTTEFIREKFYNGWYILGVSAFVENTVKTADFCGGHNRMVR